MGNRTGRSLCIGVNKVKKYRIQKSIFHKTAEELRELDKENNIKLLRLLEYMRRKNDKKKDEKDES